MIQQGEQALDFEWSGRAQRTTFVIDEGGVVAKVLPKVSPMQHDDLVLAAL